MSKQLVKICIPTLHCYDRLFRLCHHLDQDNSAAVDVAFFIIDNGGQLQKSEYFQKLQSLQSSIYLEVAPYNLGVAPSWNKFIYQHGQCIIANDDVLFSRSDIQLFLEAAKRSPETILFTPSNEGGGFTVMLVNRPGEWLASGGFDDAFAPAYFEDNDACWRLQLMNCPVGRVELRDWQHDNSSTLHCSSEQYQRNHWCCFNRNQLYYQKKWGGLPGKEQFTVPFNAKS